MFMKKKIPFSYTQYSNTVTYQEVRFKYILWCKCNEEGRDPSKFQANIWRKVGHRSYGWVLANDTLDVNIPPHERHDLYSCEGSYRPKLSASIIETSGTYHCYQYNEETEELEYLAEAETLEDAKNVTELVAIVEG